MVASGGKSRASAEEIDALLTAPETTRENVGARLAIMQRLLGLRCTESLVSDAFEALDADMNTLEGDEIIAFNATSEIYGAPRMLLAAAAEADEAAFDAAVGSAKGVDFEEGARADARGAAGERRRGLERGGHRVAQDHRRGGRLVARRNRQPSDAR